MKSDYPLNNELATTIVLDISAITNAFAVLNENYETGDILFSAITSNGDIAGHQLENKSIRSRVLMSGDTFNNYYSTDNPNGVLKYTQFLDGQMPDNWKGKYIYMLNAEDKYHNKENSKYQKLLRDKTSLCYCAVDGYLLFSPKKLREAYLGEARYWCSHTTDLGDKEHSWELKAFFDLSKGTFIPHKFDKKFFEK